MPDYEVTSEIYSECNYKTTKNPIINGSKRKNFHILLYLKRSLNSLLIDVVSEFPFEYPRNEKNIEHDEDGDLIVERTCKGSIQIGYFSSINHLYR